MNLLITGVAGFIGSNLAKRFLARGDTVLGIDNFCRGSEGNVQSIIGQPRFRFAKCDLTMFDTTLQAVRVLAKSESITEVWHMAANSDIPSGVLSPEIDLNDTFMTTFNSLKLMRAIGARTLIFASSSAIYGDLGDTVLHEEIGPLLPISNYGAMKLASEAAISAASESFLDRSYIFRFPNVIGTPATHGVILDFIGKLKVTPGELSVLGNGTQQKAYLHVDDLIDAMLYAREHASAKRNLFNIGPRDDGVTVKFIAEQVIGAVAPSAKIVYGAQSRGWLGDVPRFIYSTDKLSALGWTPQLGSSEAIRKAVLQIAEQEGCSVCRP